MPCGICLKDVVCFHQISANEKRKKCNLLRDSGYDLTEDKVMNMEYYKV